VSSIYHTDEDSILHSSKLHKHQSYVLRTAGKYCTYCTFEHEEKVEAGILYIRSSIKLKKLECFPSDFGQPNVLYSLTLIALLLEVSSAAVDMIFATWWVCVELESSSFTV
jgi:hypothetical protein